MKKIFAILLIVAIAISLTACMGSGADTGSTKATEIKVEDVDIKNYEKTFSGMQKYLKDLKLISGDKIELQADLIGAKKGVRYTADKVDFVEFYAFDLDNMTKEGKEVYDAISKGDTYDVLGLQEMKGVISKSGKYMMLYKADSTYDYSKIEKEFKKF